MGYDKVLKSNQEQAVASWIDYLNTIRIEQLIDTLKMQDDNYENSMRIMDNSLEIIKNRVLDVNRGGEKGIHGFIAEVAEVGFENAKEAISGKSPITEWVDDNGPVDIRRKFVENGKIIEQQIQQKFYHSGDGLSLGAIEKHLEKYPDFLKNGAKYQIPKDQYDKIVKLLNISEKEANMLKTSDGSFNMKQWKAVHNFFGKNDVKLDDIEPSNFEYKDVQKGVVEKSINNKKEEIKEIDKEKRDKAYKDSLPSLKEGVKVTLVSAVIEGATTMTMEIYSISKKKGGLKNLKSEDWQYIFKKSGYGTTKGGVRGATVYILSNYTAAPPAVATAMVTASFGVAEQIYQYRKGTIDENEMIINAEYLCLDATMSAISTLLGQCLIPIPILGALIGNTAGMMVYNTIKNNYREKEAAIFEGYINDLNCLQSELSKDYLLYLEKMQEELNTFMLICVNAFSIDPVEAFGGSVQLAQLVGVDENIILKSKEDIDNYFEN